jgi:hypothetical protein
MMEIYEKRMVFTLRFGYSPSIVEQGLGLDG